MGLGDWHPMDPRHVASKDVNALIDMIDAELSRYPNNLRRLQRDSIGE